MSVPFNQYIMTSLQQKVTRYIKGMAEKSLKREHYQNQIQISQGCWNYQTRKLITNMLRAPKQKQNKKPNKQKKTCKNTEVIQRDGNSKKEKTLKVNENEKCL